MEFSKVIDNELWKSIGNLALKMVFEKFGKSNFEKYRKNSLESWMGYWVRNDIIECMNNQMYWVNEKPSGLLKVWWIVWVIEWVDYGLCHCVGGCKIEWMGYGLCHCISVRFCD